MSGFTGKQPVAGEIYRRQGMSIIECIKCYRLWLILFPSIKSVFAEHAPSTIQEWT